VGNPPHRGEATTKEVASLCEGNMRRNRKREPLRVGTVSKSVLTCVCIAGLGVAYVWQKNQIYRLGDEIRKREAAATAAEKRTKMLDWQQAQLKSPALLEARCQQYGLGLVAPREQQMVRLAEPGPEWDLKLLPVAAPSPAATSAPRKTAPKPTAASANRTIARR
jgi:hypothetical protein